MLYQHLEIEAHLNPWGFNHEEFVFADFVLSIG